MMGPTHVGAGLAVASAVAVAEPAFGTAAAVGAVVGGALPDVDLLVGEHRRTLHFPVLAWPPALFVTALAMARPSAPAWGVAVGLVAFALHASSDVLGAGEELRPWERTNPDAVYCHAAGRWLRGRYLIRYDGAPEDVAATAVLAAPAVLAFDGAVGWLATGLVALGAGYALIRKRAVPYFEPIVEPPDER